MNLVKLTGLVYSQHFIRLISVFINNIYDVKNEIGLTLFSKLQVKERVHSEMKTFERLDYCPHIQPITLIFPKSAPTFHGCVSVPKICTSGDLHRTIRGPASHHPRTCITPSVDLHHTIHGPASVHLDLHQPSGPASLYRNLSGQLKKEAKKNQYNRINQ